MRRFVIAGRELTDASPAFVIAEIGNNHNGSVDQALRLIDLAHDCGVDAVKFQRRTNETLYSPALLAQPYDHEHSYGRTYGEHRQALELPLDAYPRLISRAYRYRLAFLCTAFDEQAADELVRVGVDGIKIASGGVTDTALLDHVARLGVPVIISTGGCREEDIMAAHECLPTAAFLHCTASYPAQFEELNLRYIGELLHFMPQNIIGWSGHDDGIAMALAAYILGATILEKHITAHRSQRGTDHAFSLEPVGLRKLVRDLRRLDEAMGDGVKRYYDSERRPIAKMRRRRQPDGSLQITGEVDA